MKVIGLDPGSHKTGFAILEDGKLVDHGVFNLGKTPLPERMLTLRTDLEGLLAEHGVFDLAGVETPFVGKHIGAISSLAHARGVILSIVAARATAVVDVAPSQTKKASGGGGKAHKSAVRTLMAKRFGVEFLSDDASDAVAVALAAMNVYEKMASAEQIRRELNPRRSQFSRSTLPASPRPGPSGRS